MKALDTNVLVRVIVRDDAAQATLAETYITATVQDGESLFLSAAVLCELIWVLEDAYGYDRQMQHVVLERILRTAEFTFESKTTLWNALAAFTRGKGDFSDYVIGYTATTHGCTETGTFDRALRGDAGFRQL